MKSILISIKPEYVEKILNGEKTIEIRKSMPKCKLPCKVYIYCTKAKSNKERLWRVVDPLNEVKPFYAFDTFGSHTNIINGKVVAEFTLNEVEKLENTILPTIHTCVYLTKTKRYASAVEKASCLSQDEIYIYLSGRNGYAWRIDDLIIYDEPKELSEFSIYDKTYDNVGAFGWAFPEEQKYISLKRPPQSWCCIEKKVRIRR